jgi:molecular chaperone HscB
VSGDPRADHFATLGLPRAFALDRAELDRRYREMSRSVHPDRFARASPRERRIALERATAVNAAYRTLREPLRRAEHLLALHGTLAAAPDPLDAAFLEAQLELRERLEAAHAAGDAAAAAAVAAEARAALAAIDADLGRLLACDAPGAAALSACAAAVVRGRFYEGLAAAAEAR